MTNRKNEMARAMLRGFSLETLQRMKLEGMGSLSVEEHGDLNAVIREKQKAEDK
jgi:hypothetical protein